MAHFYWGYSDRLSRYFDDTPNVAGWFNVSTSNSGQVKAKNPAKLLGYVLYWISLDTKLVEAGGIEPPSERCQSKASTCLFSDLNLT